VLSECSIAFSVTNKTPFNKSSFVIDKSGLENQARCRVQKYKVKSTPERPTGKK